MKFESLGYYRDLINSIPDIIYQIDENGVFQFLGNAVSLLGYGPEELLGRHFREILHPEDAAVFSRQGSGGSKKSLSAKVFFDERRMRPRAGETSEIRLLTKRLAAKPPPPEDGGWVFGELSARGYYETASEEGKKKFLGTIGIIRDISRRKKAEGLLRKLMWAVDQTPVSIVIADQNWIIEYINPDFIRQTGFAPQEVIGRPTNILESRYHPREFYEQIKQTLLTTGEWSGEIVNRKKNGAYYWSSVMISAVRDPNGLVTNYISIQQDLTEKKDAAQKLKTLREKEILLREIHHRVKNNLQIITSLLNLQCSTLTEERFLDVFKKCENRIRTMALIHEKLYQSSDIARIEFVDYVKSLCLHLYQEYRDKRAHLEIRPEVHAMYLDIDTAIPAGLIINELVSNAFTHGFSEGQAGEIKVTLREKENFYLIDVSNDGAAFPDDARLPSPRGLGLQLVTLLVKQLHGTLKLTRKPRTIFRVIIPAGE